MDDFNESQQNSREALSGINQTTNSVKNLLKSFGKILSTFLKWIGGILGASSPLILIILGMVVIVSVIFASVTYVFSGGYDSEKNLMTSYGGIKGDKFYGVRVVYFDEEYTSNNLKEVYLEFTKNIVLSLENNNININLTELEIENFATRFALEITEDFENKSSATLIDCTKFINHYGFDDETIIKNEKTEQDLVLESLANNIFVKDNTLNLENVLNALKTNYDNSFSYMKNVCSKILIKDYILEEDKAVKDITKQNYVGYVYMQKQDIKINSANFIFATGDKNNVEIKANYKAEEVQVIKEDKADNTWFKKSEAEKVLECDLSEFTFNEFTAIDKEEIQYLKDGKTLFDIYRENKNSILFNEQINTIDIDNILSNFNSSNYFYLRFNANTSFNVVDIVAEYEDIA